MDSAIPPLHDLPRLRDRVTVEGHDGIFIVIACNSERREVDLAGASQPGYLIGIPVSQVRPVSNQRSSDRRSRRMEPQTATRFLYVVQHA